MKINDSRITDDDIFGLIILTRKYFNDKQKHKKKKKRKYFTVLLVAILVMGMSVITIGENQIITKIFNKNRQINIDSTRNENDTINSDQPPDLKLLDEAEKKFGLMPLYLSYLPPGTTFKDGKLTEEALTIEYVAGSNYIKYEMTKNPVAPIGQLLDTITVDAIDINIYTEKNMHYATFSHKDFFYCISTDLNNKEFITVLKGLYFV